jgi:hypothetical protein
VSLSGLPMLLDVAHQKLGWPRFVVDRSAKYAGNGRELVLAPLIAERWSPTMTKMPHTPEDNLFPPSFASMNEFCRTLAVGGDVRVSPPGMRDEGYWFILLQHMDRGSKFHVIALDDESFVLHRLRQQYELLKLEPRTPVEPTLAATGIFPACLEALNRLNTSLKAHGDVAIMPMPVEQDEYELIVFFNVSEAHAYGVERLDADVFKVEIGDRPKMKDRALT